MFNLTVKLLLGRYIWQMINLHCLVLRECKVTMNYLLKYTSKNDNIDIPEMFLENCTEESKVIPLICKYVDVT